jgi:hypothetical protein
MIHPVEMYAAECDVCKNDFETYEGWSALTCQDRLEDSLNDSGWHIDGIKCYCPDCHTINDEDQVVFKVIDNEK